MSLDACHAGDGDGDYCAVDMCAMLALVMVAREADITCSEMVTLRRSQDRLMLVMLGDGDLPRSRDHLMLATAGAGDRHCSREHLMLVIAGSLLALVMAVIDGSA